MPLRRPDQIKRMIITSSNTDDGKMFMVGQIDQAYARRGVFRDPGDVARHEPGLHSIGVHFVIYPNGGQPNGRHPREPGRFCDGHEADSIAIMLVGKTAYTHQAWTRLRECVVALGKEFPGIEVVGHHQLMPEHGRPGFNVPEWLEGGMQALPGHVCAMATR